MLAYQGYKVKFAELGGDIPASYLPSSIYARTNAVIFVLDLTAPAQVEEAKQALECLLTEDHLRGKPFMLFGNKADDITDEARKELVKDMAAFRNWVLNSDRKPKPITSVAPIIWFRSNATPGSSLKLLLSKGRFNYDAIIKRSLKEQAQNRDVEMLYEEELLRKSSKEEAKPKAAKGTPENKRPSNTLQKFRKVAPVVSSLPYIYNTHSKIMA
jgi:GTPase SAR1 family protein